MRVARGVKLSTVDHVRRCFPMGSRGMSRSPVLRHVCGNLGRGMFAAGHRPRTVVCVSSLRTCGRGRNLTLSGRRVSCLGGMRSSLKHHLASSRMFKFTRVGSRRYHRGVFNKAFVVSNMRRRSSLFRVVGGAARRGPGGVVSTCGSGITFTRNPMIRRFTPTSRSGPSFFQVGSVGDIVSLGTRARGFPAAMRPFGNTSANANNRVHSHVKKNGNS